ncbi:MAG: diguanylate cyclase [Cyanobacteria bacterium P01_G01_bin.67]
MNGKALKILLVEDNLADASWISQILEEYSWQKSNLRHVKKVTEAIDTLSQDSFDAILLDLSLPDSEGITSLDIVKQKAPQLPIVVLTATDDPKVAIKSLRQGAQDYLIKGEFEGKLLTRSIQYAIERQRTKFNLRQQALMKKMLDRIRNSIDLDAILQTTATVIQQFLQSDQVLIYQCESGQSEETTVVSQSINAEVDQRSIKRFVDAVNLTSLHSILSESTSVRAVEDTWSTSVNELKVVEPQLIRSYLILPIWFGESLDYVYEDLTIPMVKNTVSRNQDEGLWGMLVAYNLDHTRKWQAWEINFLQRLTTQVTIAIQHSQLCCQLQTANQKLQQLAILDGLTGIANRRYFDLVLDKEWQRLAREQKPLSLILCDIDYFKAYNDFYGHQQGDRCLQKVAQILQKSTRRPADLAARYGGEEFALILPNTDAQGALYLAHNIVENLASKQLPHIKSRVSEFVTFSMGIACKIPHCQQPATTIIEIADHLLYKAKKAGRNQLAIAQEETYSEAVSTIKDPVISLEL